MEKISSVEIGPLKDSAFIKPLKMNYDQNGVKKEWHLVKIHDSVSILIFNITRKVLVLVKQFRPAVYYSQIPETENKNIDTKKYPGSLGITIELCAGIVDKDAPLEEIARLEVLEECGYDVAASSMERILAFRSGIGVTGDLQTLFYVEVTDSMRVGPGGGNAAEGEFIEVVEMSVDDVKKYIGQKEILSPSGFLFAIMWFFQNKIKV